MTYKLLRWYIRNMGLIGFFKSRLLRPKEINATYKTFTDYLQIPTTSDERKVMLIKANGICYENTIRDVLVKNNICIEEELVIKNYNTLMWNLFYRLSSKELSAWDAINHAYYRNEEGNIVGKAFILSRDVNMRALEKIKRKLRRKIGVLTYQVTLELENGELEKFRTTITPLHVPDEKRMSRECSIIYQYWRLNNG